MTAVLLFKIKAIEKINEEIIERLKNIKKVSVITSKVYLRDRKFDVKEENVEKDGQEMLSCWRSTETFIQIEDIFNDKIDFKCNNFDGVVKLNNELCRVASKYELFGESEKAQQELNKFLRNIETIHVCLGKIEESFQDASSNSLVTQKVNKINSLIDELLTSPETELILPQPFLWSTKDPSFKIIDHSVEKLIKGWRSINIDKVFDCTKSFSINVKIDVESMYTWSGFVNASSPLDNWLGLLKGYGFGSHSSIKGTVYGVLGTSKLYPTQSKCGYKSGDIIKITVVPTENKLQLHVNGNHSCDLENVYLNDKMWFIFSLYQIGSKVTYLSNTY